MKMLDETKTELTKNAADTTMSAAAQLLFSFSDK